MGTIERIDLALQPPHHGWLPLRLALDSFVVECVASNVLNDPLDELIEAVAFCKAPLVGHHRICLWLEPEGYAVDIVPSASSDHCIIRVSFHASFVPPMLRGELDVAFEGEADLGTTRSVMWSALARLVDQTEPALLDAWRPAQEHANRLAALRIAAPRRSAGG